MENKALVLRINESINDPNLEMPVIGAMSLDLYSRGNGSGMSTFVIGVKKETKIQIAGGELFDTSNISLGTEYMLPEGVCELKIKAIQEHGRILIKDSINIDRLGKIGFGVFKPDNNQNSPVIKLDVSYLPDSLVVIDSEESDNIIYTGDLARALARLKSGTYISIRGLESRLTGDTRLVPSSPSLLAFTYSVKNDIGSFKMSIDTLRPAELLLLRNGELYGDIANLPANMTEYNIADNVKDYTVGDIASVPSSVRTFIEQCADGLTYSGGRVWNNETLYFIVRSEFDTESTDKLLIDAANATWSLGMGLISIAGSRSSASDNAIQILQARNITVAIKSAK